MQKNFFKFFSKNSQKIPITLAILVKSKQATATQAESKQAESKQKCMRDIDASVAYSRLVSNSLTVNAQRLTVCVARERTLSKFAS